MTTTEEIIVSGENFIERRILIYAQPVDLKDLQDRAYACGYKYGWGRGFLIGLGLCGVTALCIWLALCW